MLILDKVIIKTLESYKKNVWIFTVKFITHDRETGNNAGTDRKERKNSKEYHWLV